MVGDDPKLTTLRDALELKQKQLELVMAIDHVRDEMRDPPAMLVAIVKTLTDRLQADLSLLCLADPDTGDLELKAVNDRSGRLEHLSPTTARDLACQAINSDGVVIWRGDELPPALRQHYASIHQDNAAGLQMAGIGITLNEGPFANSSRSQTLGAVLLARYRKPFDQDDVALLEAAESQIDSAVMQAYAHYELQQRNLELETIYRIDRIRDQDLTFDKMLTGVLHELCAVIHAGMGFIMLYDRAGRRLELRASTHDDLLRVTPHYDIIDGVANEALNQARLVYRNDLGDPVRSAMCIPLILHNEIIGVLGIVNRHESGGFDAEDRRLLTAIASQMDTAIFEGLERARLRQVLGRSVDPRVMERLLANPDVAFLKGERAVLSVLYADIRGSTQLAERTDPELFVGFINSYLSRMTEVILAHEGTLDKFVGDEVMALFGAPFPQTDHALRAARAGLEMQKVHQTVMETWQARGVAAAPIGIGIATGEMTVGEMGSSQRSDYTVIGRAANLGARICGSAEAGQVRVSQATYDLLAEQVEAVPISGLELKGVGDALTVYHIIHILE